MLTSILREDKIFGNDVLSHWSTQRQEGFKNYSEIFHDKFPGYTLDKAQRVVPSTAKTANLKKILGMLKS